MQNLNYKIVIFFIGILLIFNGSLMLFSSLVSYFYKDGITFQIIQASIFVISIGSILILIGRNHDKNIFKREGYLIVSLGWLLMVITGTFPYLLPF